jgi:CIC family chloride channel protein
LARFVAYALVGVLTALPVAGLEWLADDVLLDAIDGYPLWLQAALPTVGLVLTALVLRHGGRLLGGQALSPATSEEYIRSYHERRPRMRLRYLPVRLTGGALTIGLGGTLGLEGPSIYAGATVGSSVQSRLRQLFVGKDSKLLLVAGAAAGVAAIFKTPATGILFALESPYQGDVARRALLPALVASATSYLTYVTFYGTTPIFDVGEIFDEEGLSLVELGFARHQLAGAALLGLLAGLGAVVFARAIALAKRIAAEWPATRRIAAAGALLAAMAVLVDLAAGEPFTLGPGIELYDWVVWDDPELWVVAVVLGARLVTTSATLAGGGVGGLFIPLAVSGILAGDLVAGLVDLSEPDQRTLFPAIGLAAFLGAGYRTPLAAVMFVAESTGSTAFVVPALIAVAVSQVVVGGASVSSFQVDTRAGHLERRFGMPITSAMRADPAVVPTDLSLSAYFWEHALPRKELSSIVADADGRYVGMVRVGDVAAIDRGEWGGLTVGDVVHRDVRAANLWWTLREVTAALEADDLDRVGVVDAADRVVGVVTDDDVLKLDEILEETA